MEQFCDLWEHEGIPVKFFGEEHGRVLGLFLVDDSDG